MRMETKVSKGMSKRLASWLLVFAMIAAMVPLSALPNSPISLTAEAATVVLPGGGGVYVARGGQSVTVNGITASIQSVVGRDVEVLITGTPTVRTTHSNEPGSQTEAHNRRVINGVNPALAAYLVYARANGGAPIHHTLGGHPIAGGATSSGLITDIHIIRTAVAPTPIAPINETVTFTFPGAVPIEEGSIVLYIGARSQRLHVGPGNTGGALQEEYVDGDWVADGIRHYTNAFTVNGITLRTSVAGLSPASSVAVYTHSGMATASGSLTVWFENDRTDTGGFTSVAAGVNHPTNGADLTLGNINPNPVAQERGGGGHTIARSNNPQDIRTFSYRPGDIGGGSGIWPMTHGQAGGIVLRGEWSGIPPIIVDGSGNNVAVHGSGIVDANAIPNAFVVTADLMPGTSGPTRSGNHRVTLRNIPATHSVGGQAPGITEAASVFHIPLGDTDTRRATWRLTNPGGLLNAASLTENLRIQFEYFPDATPAIVGVSHGITTVAANTSAVYNAAANMVTIDARFIGTVTGGRGRYLARIVDAAGNPITGLEELPITGVVENNTAIAQRDLRWVMLNGADIDVEALNLGIAIRFEHVGDLVRHDFVSAAVSGVHATGTAVGTPIDQTRLAISVEVNLHGVAQQTGNYSIAIYNGSGRTEADRVAVMPRPVMLLRNQEAPTAGRVFFNFELLAADVANLEMVLRFTPDGDFIYRINYYEELLMFGDLVGNGQHIEYLFVRDISRFDWGRFNAGRARWVPTMNGLVGITRQIPRRAGVNAGVLVRYTGTCAAFMSEWDVDPATGIIRSFAFHPRNNPALERAHHPDAAVTPTEAGFNGAMIILRARPLAANRSAPAYCVRSMTRTFYNAAEQAFINTTGVYDANTSTRTGGQVVEVRFGMDMARAVSRIRNPDMTFVDRLYPGDRFDFSIDRVPRGAQGIVRIASHEFVTEPVSATPTSLSITPRLATETSMSAERLVERWNEAQFSSVNLRFRIAAPPRAPRTERMGIVAPRANRPADPHVVAGLTPAMGLVLTRTTVVQPGGDNIRTTVTWHNGLEARPGLDANGAVVRPDRDPAVNANKSVFTRNTPVAVFDGILREGFVETYLRLNNLADNEANRAHAASETSITLASGLTVANMAWAVENPNVLVRRVNAVTNERGLITGSTTPTGVGEDTGTHYEFELRLMPIPGARPRPMSAVSFLRLSIAEYTAGLNAAAPQFAATVSADGLTNATAAVTPASGAAGTEATVTVTPATGHTFTGGTAPVATVTLTEGGAAGPAVTLAANAEGAFTGTFERPVGAVTVTVSGNAVPSP